MLSTQTHIAKCYENTVLSFVLWTRTHKSVDNIIVRIFWSVGVCMSMWTQLTKNNILQPYLEDVIIYLTKVFFLNNGHLCGSLMIELLLNIFYFLGWKKKSKSIFLHRTDTDSYPVFSSLLVLKKNLLCRL